MSDENLALWHSVEAVHTGATQRVEQGARVYHSINGTYLVKRATEIWGPVGFDWGYEILEERFDQGHALMKQGEFLGYAVTHTIKLKVWCRQGERVGEATHFGHTKYIGLDSYQRLKTDEEAPKKSLTDALKKCLSMWGFAADIWMGEFDNPDYVAELKSREALEAEDQRDAEQAHRDQEFIDWFDGLLQGYEETDKPAALKVYHDKSVQRLKRYAQSLGKDSAKALEQLQRAYQARFRQIGQPKPLVCHDCGVQFDGFPGDVCEGCGSEKVHPAK